MGRRGARVEEASAWVFNRLAAAYPARPPYPEALVERLAALAGGRGARAADLGAGTGHLALPLAARGLAVQAVEPAAAMLAQLAARAPARGGPVPVHAAAEATGLPAAAFDLVLVADALHWIDPERGGAEAGRLLAPGGALAVVEAAWAPSPLAAGLEALLARANPRRPPPAGGRLRQLLAQAGLDGGAAEPFLQPLPADPDGVEGWLRTLSHAGPALGPAGFAALVAGARDLARAHGGAGLARALRLTWARRPPA